MVNFLGICHEPPTIVTEYCSRGSLTQVLATARTDPAVAAQLTWQRRLSMAVDAAAGMLYLHTRPPPNGPVLHRGGEGRAGQGAGPPRGLGSMVGGMVVRGWNATCIPLSKQSMRCCPSAADLKGPNLLVDVNWTVKVRRCLRRARPNGGSMHGLPSCNCRPPLFFPPALLKVTDFNLSRILLEESTPSSSMAAMNPVSLRPPPLLPPHLLPVATQPLPAAPQAMVLRAASSDRAAVNLLPVAAAAMLLALVHCS